MNVLLTLLKECFFITLREPCHNVSKTCRLVGFKVATLMLPPVLLNQRHENLQGDKSTLWPLSFRMYHVHLLEMCKYVVTPENPSTQSKIRSGIQTSGLSGPLSLLFNWRKTPSHASHGSLPGCYTTTEKIHILLSS